MISEHHCHIVDNFFANSEAVRRAFEAHFHNPDGQTVDSHGVWNYWHVPGLYTYLRADPRKIISPSLVDQFVTQLQQWSIDNLGCAKVTQPTLSLYINGCRQGLHNDAANGRWGYVWSLTAKGVPFVGGSTILMRPRPYWGTAAMDRPIAGNGLYEVLPPAANRLVVFDDRLVHGVEPVEGNMNPLDGRAVLHGHLSEGEPWAAGGLAANPSGVHAALITVQQRLSEVPGASGSLGIRITVDEAGRIAAADVLTDRVRAQRPLDLYNLLCERIGDLRFPAWDEPGVVIAWLRLGR